MSIQVLAISSSPFKGGNLERMMAAMLARSGQAGELVRLAELSISPCLGCAPLCARDNLCKVEDGFQELLPKILAADALILGSPSYFNAPNGFMLVLLERMWCLRHQRFPLEGKPFWVVAAGGVKEPEAVSAAIRGRMEAYRARCMGEVSFFSGNLPCHGCGFGKKCEVGALRGRYSAEELAELKLGPAVFSQWEDAPRTAAQVERAAEALAALG